IRSTELPEGIPPPSFSSKPPMPVRMRRSRFAVFRLINVFRLEDGSPQTFSNLRLGLYFYPVLSNDKRVEEVRVSSASHFRNLNFSRAHLHRERILFERIALQRILLQRSLTTRTLPKTVG